MKRTPFRLFAAGALALVAATATAEPNTGPGIPEGGKASDTWCYSQKITIWNWEAHVRRLEPQCEPDAKWACDSLHDAKRRLGEARAVFDYWGCRGRYLEIEDTVVEVDGVLVGETP